MRKYGREIPKCIKGGNHKWKKGLEKLNKKVRR